MSMTDLGFLFVFLPAALLLYLLPGKRVKQMVLLAVSLVFYAAGSRFHLALILLLTGMDVLLSALLVKMTAKGSRKVLLWAGVVVHLAVLIFYKYFSALPAVTAIFGEQSGLTFVNLAMPLGLSFFTFKAISLLADCYRGRVTEADPLRAALYLTFFGQIQSGPLSRYSDMDSCAGGKERLSLFGNGMYRFLCGFSKKILLANVLAKVTGEVFAAPQADMSVSLAWLGAVCYSLQLYFDFSGYSDMAVGVSNLFGYQCPENFNYPYMTASIAEFWRRWHMTLGAWFRDYIYIPLGGSRVGRARLYFNLFAVWLLTGIWHGSTWSFVFWGLTYFVLIALEKTFDLPGRLKQRWARMLYRIPVLLLINFEWVIFRAGDLKAGLRFIRNMLPGVVNPLADFRAAFLLRDNLFFIIAAVLLCFPIVPAVQKRCEKNAAAEMVWNVVQIVVLAVLFIWSVSFVVAGQNNPFAYANF